MKFGVVITFGSDDNESHIIFDIFDSEKEKDRYIEKFKKKESGNYTSRDYIRISQVIITDDDWYLTKDVGLVNNKVEFE